MWSTLKKFGLQYCDLPTMLWNVSVMLRALTLNIDSRNKKPISVFVYVICFLIAVAYFFVYLVSMMWFVFVRCRETGDLLAALIVFSLGVSSEIGTVKLVIMFQNINKIKQIVIDTLECDSTMMPGSRFSNNLLITMREVKKRAMIFWIVIIGNGVVYVVKPILLPGRHLMEDKFILYENRLACFHYLSCCKCSASIHIMAALCLILLFGLEPMYETPYYQIAFILSAAGFIFTCYLPANISALLIVITGYIEAQMLALTEEFLHL